MFGTTRRTQAAMGAIAAGLSALAAAPLAAAAQPHGAPAAPAPGAAHDLEYLVGTWDIVAETPGTAGTARFSYEVRPLVGSGAWLSGHGRSEELGAESSDVWGRDSASGEIVRMIFDAGGTYAVVRSPGWRDGRLVLEGDARSAAGVVRVRETIERIDGNRFLATWEAYRNGTWSAYSVERVTRRTGSPAATAPAAG